MAKVISFHSFRRGAGKSTLAASIVELLAGQGYRVGVFDTDLQSPSVHILFGLDEGDIKHTLNDYLWGRCKIEDAAYDVTANLGRPVSGKVILVPASTAMKDIMQVLRDGFSVDALNEAFSALQRDFNLDVVVIDSHAGLMEESLVSLAIADTLVLVLKLDKQDMHGTAVTLALADELGISRLILLVNNVPTGVDIEEVLKDLRESLGRPVSVVIAHSEEMMAMASQSIFSVTHPDHPITLRLKQLCDTLME